MANLDTYEARDVIKHYQRQQELFAPEVTIREELSERLGDMLFLDLGVGTGRTTPYFAPQVKRYVGADYAEMMIATCRETFASQFAEAEFVIADVRDMRDFASDSFNCVWFSFNGLDYINHSDRLQALVEINRVLSPGGDFIFSSHNILSTARLGEIRWTFSPKKLFRRLWRALRLRIESGKREELAKKEFAVINDGTFSGRLKTYYIRPEVQQAQLKDAGFSAARIFALDGVEADQSELCDSWLYYWCRKEGSIG